METFHMDKEDLYFNLFEHLKVQEDCELGKDDLKDIMEEFGRFTAQEIFPTREPGDVEGVHLKDGQVHVPECFKKANQLFYENMWFTLGMSEEYTELNVPQSIYTACTSLTTGANVSWGMYQGLSRAAFNTMEKVGTPEQKKRFLPPMISGAWGGTMCLTEAGAGSDVGALTTKATKEADGSYKISGTKIFISSGDNNLYDNIIHLVLARVDGAPAGTKGISLFIVPKVKVDESGTLQGSNDVQCTKVEEKMGLHGQATCELVFGAEGNCRGYLLGEECQGMANMFIMMNEARLLCALQGEAQGSLAYLMSKKYATERDQFGKTLDRHPDVKRMLLKMRSMTRGMRSLGLYAAKCLDQSENEKCTPEARKEAHTVLSLLTPVCKAYFTDQGFQVSVDAVQIHGGYGYCREYGVEQMCRDVKIASIYEGTNGIQAIDLVMRKILKDQGAGLKLLLGRVEKTLVAAHQAGEFNHVLPLFQKVLAMGQKVVGQFAGNAMQGKTDEILWHCTDTLEFVGHLLTAWRHLDGALLAHSHKKGGATDPYLDQKMVDLEVFCSNYLNRNLYLGELLTQRSGHLMEAAL